MYKIRYNLDKLQEIFNELIKVKGRQFMDIEDLLFEIDFNLGDINKFYIKHVKHRFRYGK